jgi:hypothetical protein
MHPIGLHSTVKRWAEQDIADKIWGDVVMTPEFRDWMDNHLGERFGDKLWRWDHFREEDEVAIYFVNPRHATLFKLAWC